MVNRKKVSTSCQLKYANRYQKNVILLLAFFLCFYVLMFKATVRIITAMPKYYAIRLICEGIPYIQSATKLLTTNFKTKIDQFFSKRYLLKLGKHPSCRELRKKV